MKTIIHSGTYIESCTKASLQYSLQIIPVILIQSHALSLGCIVKWPSSRPSDGRRSRRLVLVFGRVRKQLPKNEVAMVKTPHLFTTQYLIPCSRQDTKGIMTRSKTVCLDQLHLALIVLALNTPATRKRVTPLPVSTEVTTIKHVTY